MLALLALATTFLQGLYVGDFNADAQRYVAARRENDRLKTRDASPLELTKVKQELIEATKVKDASLARKTIHFYLGVASSLLAILVSSISVTYFIGTNRWCKEVVETYRLSSELVKRSDDLKRRTFPYALAGMLTVIVIVALGGLSDPSIPWRRAFEADQGWFNAAFPPAAMVNVHYIASMIGLVLLGYAFWVQAGRIVANYALINEILAEVQRIRKVRGLDAADVITQQEHRA